MILLIFGDVALEPFRILDPRLEIADAPAQSSRDLGDPARAEQEEKEDSDHQDFRGTESTEHAQPPEVRVESVPPSAPGRKGRTGWGRRAPYVRDCGPEAVT